MEEFNQPTTSVSHNSIGSYEVVLVFICAFYVLKELEALLKHSTLKNHDPAAAPALRLGGALCCRNVSSLFTLICTIQ